MEQARLNIDEPPRQGEMPFALVAGEPVLELPRDLYIPPHALEVFLEAFEGPLDLLLYLIRRQSLDILNIPIADVTRQYMEYIDLMTELRLELAAEYLVMAAMLAEIKSRMLLPRPRESTEEEEGDPRAELVRRLQQYERYKAAAEGLDALPRAGRDIHEVQAAFPHAKRARIEPRVSLADLLSALNDVMQRAEMYSRHHVVLEPLSVRERMSKILELVGERGNSSSSGRCSRARRGSGESWSPCLRCSSCCANRSSTSSRRAPTVSFTCAEHALR